ncbi:MAG: hypothetical protein GXP55_00390, partial [Deltaproteobacteria bacterium]|nr:hypothetical protein [Deltaproteobacteria bacterium]
DEPQADEVAEVDDESGEAPAAEFDDETDTGDLADLGLPLPSDVSALATPAPELEEESPDPLATGEIEVLTTGELGAVSPEELAALGADQGVQVLATFGDQIEEPEELMEI